MNIDQVSIKGGERKWKGETFDSREGILTLNLKLLERGNVSRQGGKKKEKKENIGPSARAELQRTGPNPETAWLAASNRLAKRVYGLNFRIRKINFLQCRQKPTLEKTSTS